MQNKKVIGWWSGGITSAVACKESLRLYGDENVRLVFMDTKNEDDDTYRFKVDCENWYGKEIETITGIGAEFKSIEDVWYKYNSLNVAHGAICSTHLKRLVREAWQKENEYDMQAFGYEFVLREMKRAIAFRANHADAKPFFPLLMMGYDKEDCLKIVQSAGIEVPKSYRMGLNNNNCLKTGCVQGGIGYWQLMRKIFPDKFDKMALVEHDLTNRKGKPVTMLKEQGEKNKGKLVFLKPHPDYPDHKDISMMEGRPPKPLMECNGFCGTNDLEKNETEGEINFAEEL